jgi:hypothetical protein
VSSDEETGALGRPRAFDGPQGDERREALLKAIGAGNTRECAARAVGVAPSTLYAELDRNESFRSRVHLADAESEARMVELVRKAAVTDHRAAQWWLERRRPKEWGRTDRVEMVDAEQAAREKAREMGIDEEVFIAALEDEKKKRPLTAGRP